MWVKTIVSLLAVFSAIVCYMVANILVLANELHTTETDRYDKLCRDYIKIILISYLNYNEE